jgi:hypothetical protein
MLSGEHQQALEKAWTPGSYAMYVWSQMSRMEKKSNFTRLIDVVDFFQKHDGLDLSPSQIEWVAQTISEIRED